jgi:hemolysin activation/secretion protein
LSIACGLLAGGAQAQVLPAIPNAGGVSNANQRNQEVIQQQTDTTFNGPLVVGPQAPETFVPPAGGATFLLKKVEFDHSEFISAQELDALAAPYIGRKVDNADIQRLLKSVNDIYAERRVITALAYLPKQDLSGGVLKVAMVEGKLGALSVKGNAVLPTQIVTDRIHPPVGAVINVPDLEDDVAWFNKSHNAQVQASLQPGASFGLTDVQLAVLEPHVNVLQIFTDNMGVESVGQYEGGVNFQHYGLLGFDDKFTFYGVASQGNYSANVAYNLAVNPWGGRVGVSATAGTIRVFEGAYALLGIKGRSDNVSVNLSQPVFVNATWAALATGALTKSDYQSNTQGVLETNNLTSKATVGVTLSYTSAPFQASISPTYSFARTEFAAELPRATEFFEAFNGVYAASLRLPQEFNMTLAGGSQWASKKLLSGDQLFQIGGPTTVRGYPTNAVAGYAGYYANLELHHGLNQVLEGLDVFGFYDNGMIFSTYPRSVTMNSVGAGLSWDTHKYVTTDLSFGVPLTKAVNNQGQLYFYYRITAKFD